LAVKDLPLDRFVRMVALPCLELLLEVSRVLFPAAGVGDDVELVGKAGDDCIVYNAAGVGVKKGGEGRLVFWKG
jgi:hypothetical protein